MKVKHRMRYNWLLILLLALSLLSSCFQGSQGKDEAQAGKARSSRYIVAVEDEPDTFIYTFFGTKENTVFRSICYQREDIMERVRNARMITDPDARLQEYRDLERIIIQEDAAWIPLFSRQRVYVTLPRIQGLQASWNGSVKTKYRETSLVDEGGG